MANEEDEDGAEEDEEYDEDDSQMPSLLSHDPVRPGPSRRRCPKRFVNCAKTKHRCSVMLVGRKTYIGALDKKESEAALDAGPKYKKTVGDWNAKKGGELCKHFNHKNQCQARSFCLDGETNKLAS